MNNKPTEYRVEYLCGGCNKAHAWGECTEEQPLNTHPAKELGYNDIMGTWWETMPNAKSCEGIFEFARAILKKAQEK